MSFYLIPPTGVVSIDLLQQWTIKRANFLRYVYNNNNSFAALKSFMEHESAASEYADCLIEGSAKDVISHFTLRLACSSDKVARDVILSSESALFRYRLQTLSKPQFLKFLHHFHRLRLHFLSVTSPRHHRDSCLKEIVEFLKNVGGSVDWSDLVDCFKSCCVGCKQCTLKIPFRFVTSLISERSAQLHYGKVSVSSGHLLDLLVAVFEAWFEYGLIAAVEWRKMVVIEDDRLKLIFTKCKNALKGYDSSINQIQTTSLRSCHVDEFSKYFPPCMSVLHSKLRSNHRLKHMSRVSYSLFLKSIGMPLQEALEFWRGEYSQTVALGYRGCQHSWHKDNKRYMYGLRHLYGQEGSRANYQSFTCRYIQNHTWGPNEEGGCPFKHSSLSSLQHLLQCKKLSSWRNIESLVSKESYSLACHTYLNELMNINETGHEDVTNSSFDNRADSGYDSLQAEATDDDRQRCETTHEHGAVLCLNAPLARFNSSPSLLGGGNDVSVTSLTKCVDHSAQLKTVGMEQVTTLRPPTLLVNPVVNPVDFVRSYQQLMCDLQSVGTSNVPTVS